MIAGIVLSSIGLLARGSDYHLWTFLAQPGRMDECTDYDLTLCKLMRAVFYFVLKILMPTFVLQFFLSLAVNLVAVPCMHIEKVIWCRGN